MNDVTQNDVTQILEAIEQGDPSASDALLPVVYQELRVLAKQRLANEKPGQTLQATDLVHEAYLRLVGCDQNQQQWNSRGHFYAAAANAMRRILVDIARRKKTIRHGGEHQRVDAEINDLAAGYKADEVVDIDHQLQLLKVQRPEIAQLVELKYFAGFTLEEIAELCQISERTAYRHWAYAKAWLREAIEADYTPG